MIMSLPASGRESRLLLSLPLTPRPSIKISELWPSRVPSLASHMLSLKLAGRCFVEVLDSSNLLEKWL